MWLRQTCKRTRGQALVSPPGIATVHRKKTAKQQFKVLLSVIDASSDSGQVNTAGCEDEINNNDDEE
ncbi:hypothetical protein [Corynebacterium sp. LK10]|uniref:hypothetical protein n=1 Tax=Corynebacterium sp. LK10 TaxID=2022656 RepID=UPI0011C7520D|nr:hypothetical protein [Corynebacterium sp. LK10]